jgi:hypothetical protein
VVEEADAVEQSALVDPRRWRKVASSAGGG